MNKKIILCLIVIGVYVYLATYEREVFVKNALVTTVRCQETLKSGTLLRATYVIDDKANALSILPKGIDCLELIKRLKINNNVVIRFKKGNWGRIFPTHISIDDGLTFYGP